MAMVGMCRSGDPALIAREGPRIGTLHKLKSAFASHHAYSGDQGAQKIG